MEEELPVVDGVGEGTVLHRSTDRVYGSDSHILTAYLSGEKEREREKTWRKVHKMGLIKYECRLRKGVYMHEIIRMTLLY